MTHKKHVTVAVIIRSIIFWLCIGVVAVLYLIPALILYACIPLKVRHKLLTSWGMLFAVFAKSICNVKYVVRGKENIIDTPGIIASNHQSMWETIVFTQVFPQHVWILKKELLKVPFFGWILATLSPIAINRSDRKLAVQQILSQGMSKIKAGFWILLFPEGTRAKPGKTLPFKVGVGRMATGLNLPVLPVSHNAGYALPKRSFLLYPGTIEIVIGKVIYPGSNDTPESITKAIEATVINNLATISEYA